MSTSGLILLNKEKGLTSQTAVNRVKHLFGAEKAGHTGTLDPMAEGVLPILLGRAVKASEFLLCSEKHYLAELTLGVVTDTGDATGRVISRNEAEVPESEVQKAGLSFLGESLQVPPMYSALKVGGKKLCDLARAGVEIDRAPRAIVISKLVLSKKSSYIYNMEVECSKGTYIRVLCEDIGKKCGVGGIMSALTRLSAAGFPLSACHTLAELEQMGTEERLSCLVPLSEVFKNYEKVVLPPFFERLARNGLPIYQKKIGSHFPVRTMVALYGQGGFFALAESVVAEDGEALKPIRQF